MFRSTNPQRRISLRNHSPWERHGKRRRAAEEDAAFVGRRRPGQGGEDGVRIDVQIFAPRQERRGVGPILRNVAKFRRPQQRADRAARALRACSSAQLRADGERLLGRILAKCRARSRWSRRLRRGARPRPKAHPAQKPAICPAVSASTARAGGNDGELDVAPGLDPCRRKPIAQQQIVRGIGMDDAKRRAPVAQARRQRVDDRNALAVGAFVRLLRQRTASVTVLPPALIA